MNSSRSNTTVGSDSDCASRRRTFQEDSEYGDEPLTHQDARQAMDSAVDHVFGKEDAIEACELYFDAPYDQTDLSEFRQEMQTELAHVGLSDEHLANINIDLEPGSIVARLVGPEPTIDMLAKLPLRGMLVLGYPACFSRDEFGCSGSARLGMDMCGMEDTPFCHSKGGSVQSTPSSQASSLKRQRVARPKPAELDVLADELRSSRSSRRSASSRSAAPEEAEPTPPEAEGGGTGSGRTSEDSSVLGVLPPPPPDRSLSGFSSRPSECELQQLATEVGLRCGVHREQAAQDLLEGMAGWLFDGDAPPEAAARVLSGKQRPSATELDEVARRVASKPGGGGAREQGNIRIVLSQLTDGMFGEASPSGSGAQSPVLHTARSSIRSGASASATGSQDFNFDAHQVMMELACTVLSRDV